MPSTLNRTKDPWLSSYTLVATLRDLDLEIRNGNLSIADLQPVGERNDHARQVLFVLEGNIYACKGIEDLVMVKDKLTHAGRLAYSFSLALGKYEAIRLNRVQRARDKSTPQSTAPLSMFDRFCATVEENRNILSAAVLGFAVGYACTLKSS